VGRVMMKSLPTRLNNYALGLIGERRNEKAIVSIPRCSTSTPTDAQGVYPQISIMIVKEEPNHEVSRCEGP
jgi:hypothetical protein